MGTGLHTAGIPDEPTIDPSLIRYDPGENSNGPRLAENVESLQANEFCLPESIRVSPFEALDIAGVAAVDPRNALAHTYPHTIAPDYCWKVQQAELIERIRSTRAILSVIFLKPRIASRYGRTWISLHRCHSTLWLDGLIRWDKKKMLLIRI
ncbi:hypothetical protein BB8028_0001g16560 [Beauveria bassiana]|uniref:Uncharacterized protein n=1 Tax=Beauveria bassiana TaxID=176275 RepID=A0A2S7Y0A1_BEABA|nr:hypothetical protein BB8028_0001g16560 [Beauveria bassiana]